MKTEIIFFELLVKLDRELDIREIPGNKYYRFCVACEGCPIAVACASLFKDGIPLMGKEDMVMLMEKYPELMI